MNKECNFSVYTRIFIVTVVLVISVLSVLAGFPLTKLLGISPSDLSGSEFQPNLKTLFVVVIIDFIIAAVLIIVFHYLWNIDRSKHSWILT